MNTRPFPFLVLALLASFALIDCICLSAPMIQIGFGHDLPVLLECGWKWNHSIYPHHDFHSNMGIVTCFLVGLGIRLGGFLWAMTIARCAFALLILPFCLYVSFTRFTPWIALLIAVTLETVTLSPHFLRMSYFILSDACIYNRWGYSLFACILLILCRPDISRIRNADLWDGCALGLLITIAMFLKITYGTLGLSAIAGFALINLRRLPFYLATLSAAAAGILFFVTVLHLDIGAYMRDMSLFAKIRVDLDLPGLAMAILLLFQPLSLFVALALVTGAPLPGASRRECMRRGFEIFVIASGFVVYSLVIIMTNAPIGPEPESPLLAIGALVLLARLLEVSPPGESETPLRNTRQPAWLIGALWALSLILLPIFWLSCLSVKKLGHSLIGGDWVPMALLVAATVCITLIRRPDPRLARLVTGGILVFGIAGLLVSSDLKSMRFLITLKAQRHRLSTAETFRAGPLRGIQIMGSGANNQMDTTYVAEIEEGLTLIEQSGGAGKPALTLDFSNPFNVGRGVPPPRGSPPGFQLGFLNSATLGPPAEQVFDGAEIVMLPRRYALGNTGDMEALLHLYGDYLQKHYVFAGESKHWIMFRLR